jgi:uncharacterized protein YkwD
MGILRSRRLIAVLAGALLLTGVASWAPAAGRPVEAADATERSTRVAGAELRDNLLELTNEARERFDRAPLDLARAVSRYATRHSRQMADRGELFHSTWGRLERVLEGTGWQVAGENVGMGPSIDDVQQAFMRSGPHRHNVLLRAFDHAAIGVVERGGSVWITVVFYGS